MSLHIDFEPHSWYMGFAIKQTRTKGGNVGIRFKYDAYIDDGIGYWIDTVEASTREDLQAKIRAYHLGKRNGYGERIAKNRLASIRESIEAESISYGEIAELQALWNYIDKSDTLLLEWAAVPEEPKG